MDYVLTMEFKSIPEHSVLFANMCKHSAEQLVATGGLIALGPCDIRECAAEQPNNGMELTSAPQSAGSVKYEIALCVFQDYKAFCDECESNYMPFPEFCKKHIDVGA